MAREFSKVLGHQIGVISSGATSPGNFTLNSQGVLGTSGRFLMLQHVPVLAQSSAAMTLYLYMITKTLSPTDMRAVVYDVHASNTNRRGTTANGGSSGASDWSGSSSGTWNSIAMSGVTTVIAPCTPIVIGTYNNLALASTNYPDVAVRGGTDQVTSPNYFMLGGRMQNDLSGWLSTVDPVQSYTNAGVWVVKYGDGTVVGQPYTQYVAAHPSNNQDHRGMQFTPPEDVVVSGVLFPSSVGAAVVCDFYIHTAAGSEILHITSPHLWHSNLASSYRFAPITLTGGTTYHATIKPQSNSTILRRLYMGQSSPPADVLACRPCPDAALVYGPTPGSFTVETNRFPIMALLVDNWPEIAGSGGTTAPAGLHGIGMGTV